jgi:AraC-like DNA-binding protein
MAVQRRSDASLTAIALALGYGSSEDLSHMMRNCFGVTPSYVRERLGWAWLGSKWLNLNGRR